MRTVNAALVGPRRFSMVERDLSPGPDQVLIRITACGVCHSEMRPYVNGPAPGAPPLLLGHEGVGEVAEIGPGVDGLAVGDAVSGLFRQAFGTHAIADSRHTLRLSRRLAEQRPLLEPMKCALMGARTAAYEVGDAVGVVGCGYMGLLTIACLRSPGLRHLVAIDLVPERLALAGALGATASVDARQGRSAVEARVREVTQGRMLDVAVEAAGNGSALELAGAILRRGQAKLVMLGYHQERQAVDLSGFAAKGLVMHVAHTPYSRDEDEDLRRAHWALESELVRPGGLVTHRFPLAEIGAAFEIALNQPPGYVKALVEP
jgi:threonine dehydrogenase-like Zn-dependent dehydrogenase